MTSIEYQCLEGVPTGDILEWLTDINQKIFGFNEKPEHLTSLFQSRQNVLVCLAFQGGRPVGFKVGFQDDRRSFESWRGGVLDEARRQGIAWELMRLQHNWCAEKGFRVIKTVTNSDNTAMLILNLRSGFEIVGSFVNRRRRLKILQEKYLVS